jgi:hypothetical protein
MNINWINSWSAHNKKRVFEINIRLGKLTVLQIDTGKKFRFIVLNLGFEI